MKRIMFNDRLGLTDAVIEKRKTVTRRMVCKPNYDEVFDNSVDRFNKGWIDYIELIGGGRAYTYKAPYKVGEVVAVAQNYNDIVKNDIHFQTVLVGNDILGRGPACNNKMYVKADLMPHRIRILSVTAEQLQDITEEGCLAEGILLKENRVWCNHEEHFITDYRFPNSKYVYATAKEAFATLINKISGKGTWNVNPWVWRIEFELIK